MLGNDSLCNLFLELFACLEVVVAKVVNMDFWQDKFWWWHNPIVEERLKKQVMAQVEDFLVILQEVEPNQKENDSFVRWQDNNSYLVKDNYNKLNELLNVGSFVVKKCSK